MAAYATTSSLILPAPLTPRSACVTAAAVCCLGNSDYGRPSPGARNHGRRQSLLELLSMSAPLALGLAPAARADDIPLFGLRKKLRKIEEGAEEIVREGEKAVEEGIVAVEKEILVAEKEIGAAAAGAATGLELGLGEDLVQAGAVAAAELVGVLVAVSVVNGILGPEGQKY